MTKIEKKKQENEKLVIPTLQTTFNVCKGDYVCHGRSSHQHSRVSKILKKLRQ